MLLSLLMNGLRIRYSTEAQGRGNTTLWKLFFIR